MPVDLAIERGRTSLQQRLARLRSKSWHVGQCALAAGAAWYIAVHVFGHDTPFFAPIAAVVSLGTSYGQRLRRVTEVTLGVAIGVFMGDVLTHWLGSGAWQLALIVSLAMVFALLLDAGAIFVTQAAVQSIVVSTLVPDPGAAFVRWTDALIGGGVALVAASLVPRAPLRRPRELSAVVVRKMASVLRGAADCMLSGDFEQARSLLGDVRGTDSLIEELRAAAREGLSVIASSPFRVRHRGQVRQMADLVEPMDFAMRNARVLVRRVAVSGFRDERIPPAYADLVRGLADCAERIAIELENNRLASNVRPALIELARATAHMERTKELSSEVVLAQVRSLIADCLAITGLDPVAATEAIPPLD